MGGISTASNTAWTLSLMFSIAFGTMHAVAAQQHADGSDSELQFLQDLGIQSKPNVAKSNISQEEYTEKMNLYLNKLEESQVNHLQDIPQLLTYNSENKSWRRRRPAESIRLRLHVKPMKDDAHIQSAELRLLLPHHPHHNTTHMRLYQVTRTRRRELLSKKVVYLSHQQPKWIDMDATKAFDYRNTSGRIDLELECSDCRIETLRPLQSSLNILVLPARSKREKRSYFDMGRPTDCTNINLSNNKKPNCCRHDMHVSFEKLNMAYIIQPKHYEAGFCKGRCPIHFNHATNHSRIQSLVHKLDRRATPRSCCAPSKLEPLEILMVHPHDPSKLVVEKWNDMSVAECLCS